MRNKTSYIVGAICLFIAGIVLYIGHNRVLMVDTEESEINNVLESLYRAELNYFSTSNFYSDEVSQFNPHPTRRPTVVGAFPGCSSASTEAFHIFLGPYDETFKEQARASLEKAQIQGKCTDLTDSFTIFVGQDLDGDADLEIRSIDEDETVKILYAD